METYPVDVEPEQIARWLLDEDHLRVFDLLITATRSYRERGLATSEDGRLGDIEREDIGRSIALGVLEVRPKAKPSQWILRLRVEDDMSPPLPEDGPASEEEEEIDLATFYETFIASGRGLAEASAEVESPAAKAQLTRLLDAILTDRHQRVKSA